MGAHTHKSLSYRLILLLCLVGLAACSPSTGGNSSSSLSDVNPIKIGASVSLTGDFSDDGKALRQG